MMPELNFSSCPNSGQNDCKWNIVNDVIQGPPGLKVNLGDLIEVKVNASLKDEVDWAASDIVTINTSAISKCHFLSKYFVLNIAIGLSSAHTFKVVLSQISVYSQLI